MGFRWQKMQASVFASQPGRSGGRPASQVESLRLDRRSQAMMRGFAILAGFRTGRIPDSIPWPSDNRMHGAFAICSATFVSSSVLCQRKTTLISGPMAGVSGHRKKTFVKVTLSTIRFGTKARRTILDSGCAPKSDDDERELCLQSTSSCRFHESPSAFRVTAAARRLGDLTTRRLDQIGRSPESTSRLPLLGGIREPGFGFRRRHPAPET